MALLHIQTDNKMYTIVVQMTVIYYWHDYEQDMFVCSAKLQIISNYQPFLSIDNLVHMQGVIITKTNFNSFKFLQYKWLNVILCGLEYSRTTNKVFNIHIF